MTSVILVIPTLVHLTEVTRTIQASVLVTEAIATITTKKELELKKSTLISSKVKKKTIATSSKATLWKRKEEKVNATLQKRKKKKVKVILITTATHQRFHLEKKKITTKKNKVKTKTKVKTTCHHRHRIVEPVVEEEVPEQKELILIYH